MSLGTFLSFTVVCTASAFSVVPCLHHVYHVSATQSPTVLYPIRCYDKYYQLEEMEDKDTCTTELFLQADGVVDFGDTDGPPFTKAEGRWRVPDGTNDYSMTITRTFRTGRSGTDIGEFEFDLSKTYSGEMTVVGESVAVTGSMRTKDTAADIEQEVGFFNMIDGTMERLGGDKRVS